MRSLSPIITVQDLTDRILHRRSSTAFTSTNTSGTYQTTPTNFDFSAELSLDCALPPSPPLRPLLTFATPISRRPILVHPD